MSRKRFILVFILLVVILLVASALFGVLTYGLNTQEALDPTPEPGSTGPMEWVTLAGAPGPPSSGKLEQPSGSGSANPFVL
jgi:hypothetical protein